MKFHPRIVRLSVRSAPFVLLGILLIGFGLKIPYLGFYQDDWHHIYFAHTLGLSHLRDLFLYDARPAAANLYIAVFSVLGFKPAAWQLYTLGLHFFTALFGWLSFTEIWPDHQRQATWAAVLFAIYPTFKLQPLSVAYMLHWSSFMLFALSVWAMARSITRSRGREASLVFGLISSAAQMAFIEYFTGLELIRPLILWLLISREIQPAGKRLIKTILAWLPYLLLLAVFLIYRIYFIPLPEPGYVRNRPEVLFALLHTPLSTGIGLAQNAIQDTIYVLLYSWFPIFEPATVNIFKPAYLLASLLVGIFCFYYFNHLEEGDSLSTEKKSAWHRTAFWIGLALVLFGPIPGWLTERSVAENINWWRDRFVMASMLGAALVIVALIEWMARDVKRQNLVLAVLVAGSVNLQININDQFRMAWEKQTNFYRQLAWRAPYLQPKTILFSDVEFLPFMGQFPVSFAVSNLYPKTNDTMDLDYWFISLSDEYPERPQGLLNGITIKYEKGFRRFKGNSLDSLVFTFAPEKVQCLWVLPPEAKNWNTLPQILRDVAPLSNLSRISAGPTLTIPFLADIFDEADQNEWCYIFEKAALAQQQKDWAEILYLWQAAQKNGLQPKNGLEYIPFIEASAYHEWWDQAQELTFQALQKSSGIKQTLCSTWEQIDDQAVPSPSKEKAYQQLQIEIKCNP